MGSELPMLGINSLRRHVSRLEEELEGDAEAEEEERKL